MQRRASAVNIVSEYIRGLWGLAGALLMTLACAFAHAQNDPIPVTRALNIALKALDADEVRSDVSLSFLNSSEMFHKDELSAEDVLVVAGRLPVWRVTVAPVRVEGSRGWTNVLFIDARTGDVVKRVRR